MKKYKKLDDFYIEEGEEPLIRHILPGIYVDQNLHKNNIDAGYAARFLQNELNSILSSFANGGFSYRGFMMYPFVKDVSKENINRIKILKEIAILLNDNGHDFSKSISEYRKSIDSHGFASILSALYRDFSSIKTKNTKLIKKPA